MRKWILVAALVTAPAWAQEQCAAYRDADAVAELQFFPHGWLPANTYDGISYNSESLVQVDAADLSGRRGKAVNKKYDETCDCFKMILDDCKTIYVPTDRGAFTVLSAYNRGMRFIVPKEKR